MSFVKQIRLDLNGKRVLSKETDKGCSYMWHSPLNISMLPEKLEGKALLWIFQFIISNYCCKLDMCLISLVWSDMIDKGIFPLGSVRVYHHLQRFCCHFPCTQVMRLTDIMSKDLRESPSTKKTSNFKPASYLCKSVWNMHFLLEPITSLWISRDSLCQGEFVHLVLHTCHHAVRVGRERDGKGRDGVG